MLTVHVDVFDSSKFHGDADYHKGIHCSLEISHRAECYRWTTFSSRLMKMRPHPQLPLPRPEGGERGRAWWRKYNLISNWALSPVDSKTGCPALGPTGTPGCLFLAGLCESLAWSTLAFISDHSFWKKLVQGGHHEGWQCPGGNMSREACRSACLTQRAREPGQEGGAVSASRATGSQSQSEATGDTADR